MDDGQETNTVDNLFNDYVELFQKYKDSFAPKEFGQLMLMYSSKILLDCAPNPLDAIRAINESIGNAIMIYQSENNIENE